MAIIKYNFLMQLRILGIIVIYYLDILNGVSMIHSVISINQIIFLRLNKQAQTLSKKHICMQHVSFL